MTQTAGARLPIFLVGYMCSGKTTLGRALADKLGCEFVDLDEYIESRQGCSIADIFVRDGEASFRAIEQKALDEVINNHATTNAVIALGGGTPCVAGVMAKLNRVGLTVHLRTDVDRIVERLIEGGTKRPMVARKDEATLKAMVREMLNEREPYYSLAAFDFDSTLLETQAQIDGTVERFITRFNLNPEK